MFIHLGVCAFVSTLHVHSCLYMPALISKIAECVHKSLSPPPFCEISLLHARFKYMQTVQMLSCTDKTDLTVLSVHDLRLDLTDLQFNRSF